MNTHLSKRRIVDLTKEVRYNADDPGFMRVRIKHKPHRKGRLLVRLLGLPFGLMPKDFEGWADDTITKMGVHSTTHIDAPWHYGSTGPDGNRLPTIEEIPLDLCFGPGVVFDMTHKADGEPITVADMEKSLAESGAQISDGTIALIRTGRDKYLGQKDYWQRGTGMSEEATEWLLDRGVKVAGVDQWGWDLPFKVQIAQAKKDGGKTRFWEGHLVGRKRPYWHMEQLCGLDQLPSHGFEVGVFPLKLKGASAAPARVVAFLPE